MRRNAHATSPNTQNSENEPCQAAGSEEQIGKIPQIILIRKRLVIITKGEEIRMKMNLSKAEQEMLIDTGASLTLISRKNVRKGSIIISEHGRKFSRHKRRKGKTNKSGINVRYTTIGLGHYKLKHEFQVVDDSVSLSAEC